VSGLVSGIHGSSSGTGSIGTGSSSGTSSSTGSVVGSGSGLTGSGFFFFSIFPVTQTAQEVSVVSSHATSI
jgi:hypothetical protein